MKQYIVARKAVKGGYIERKHNRDIPGGPKDGYRRTTTASRRAERTYYFDTMGNKSLNG